MRFFHGIGAASGAQDPNVLQFLNSIAAGANNLVATVEAIYHAGYLQSWDDPNFVDTYDSYWSTIAPYNLHQLFRYARHGVVDYAAYSAAWQQANATADATGVAVTAAPTAGTDANAKAEIQALIQSMRAAHRAYVDSPEGQAEHAAKVATSAATHTALLAKRAAKAAAAPATIAPGAPAMMPPDTMPIQPNESSYPSPVFGQMTSIDSSRYMSAPNVDSQSSVPMDASGSVRYALTSPGPTVTQAPAAASSIPWGKIATAAATWFLFK